MSNPISVHKLLIKIKKNKKNKNQLMPMGQERDLELSRNKE